MNESLCSLFKKLNYQFKDSALLELALTHRSASSSNNERLEYLGDAILGFVIAESLFNRFSDAPEGVLTRLRASLVKKTSLARLAKKLDLGEFLQLGTGELKSGGWRRDSILADALEAIIGAIYLDSNFDCCRKFIIGIYTETLAELNLENTSKDAKTRLQEHLQARQQGLPVYEVIAEEGQDHERLFTVACQVDMLGQSVSAKGKSKRVAEQAAAEKALAMLELDKP